MPRTLAGVVAAVPKHNISLKPVGRSRNGQTALIVEIARESDPPLQSAILTNRDLRRCCPSNAPFEHLIRTAHIQRTGIVGVGLRKAVGTGHKFHTPLNILTPLYLPSTGQSAAIETLAPRILRLSETFHPDVERGHCRRATTRKPTLYATGITDFHHSPLYNGGFAERALLLGLFLHRHLCLGNAPRQRQRRQHKCNKFLHDIP